MGVGASAGGLEAFTLLLKDVPVNTGMGFVLVQHLDPVHESALTQILAKATAMPVREAANNLPVEPNHVYIIPPNRNMTIAQGRLKLAPRRQTAGAHRSIDVFFESLAQDQRERAIGVILSGTASDGTLGLEAIKAEGGLTLAQDESAKYDSMPRSAIAAGCVDFAAITKAKKQNATVRREDVRINQNGHTRTVNIEVTPLKNVKERCYLIVFEPAEKRGLPLDKGLPKPRGQAVPRSGRAPHRRAGNRTG